MFGPRHRAPRRAAQLGFVRLPALSLALGLLGCASPFRSLEPLTEAELAAPPSPPQTLGRDGERHESSDADERQRARYFYGQDAWTEPMSQRRDAARVEADWGPALLAPADLDARAEAALSLSLNEIAYRANNYDSDRMFVFGGLWLGDRFRVLAAVTRRGGDPHCNPRANLLVVDLARTGPGGDLVRRDAWQLYTDEGPFVLGDGRILLTTQTVRVVHIDPTGRSETLDVFDDPALLSLDVDGNLTRVVEAELGMIRVDERDRVWAIEQLRGRDRLVGLRADGRAFFRARLPGRAWGTVPRVTPEGPCVDISVKVKRRVEPKLACFDHDGELRSFEWEQQP